MQCLTQQTVYSPNALPNTLVGIGLVLILLLVPTFAAAKIYKTVDEDGNVSYSDVPPADTTERTESTIELEINNTYNAEESGPLPGIPGQGSTNSNGSSNAGDIVSADGSTDPATAGAAYESIAISAPAADSSLRSNNGDVTLSISLQPSLRAGDQVRFFMDGKPVGTVNGTSLSLTNIDRGVHTLAAVVLDGAGKPRISSSTTSFSLQRFVPKRVSVN